MGRAAAGAGAPRLPPRLVAAVRGAALLPLQPRLVRRPRRVQRPHHRAHRRRPLAVRRHAADRVPAGAPVRCAVSAVHDATVVRRRADHRLLLPLLRGARHRGLAVEAQPRRVGLLHAALPDDHLALGDLLHGLPDGAAVDGGARRLPHRRRRTDHRARLVRPRRLGRWEHGAAERLRHRQPGRGDAIAALSPGDLHRLVGRDQVPQSLALDGAALPHQHDVLAGLLRRALCRRRDRRRAARGGRDGGVGLVGAPASRGSVRAGIPARERSGSEQGSRPEPELDASVVD